MANLTRLDPFSLRSSDPFDEVFNGFFRPVNLLRENSQPQIKMDVRENENSYIVHAEIPGVKKEDIHVTIDGNQVSLSAESRRENEAKEGERFLRSERYYGKVSRTFVLDSEIDEAQSEAHYRDGVLELVLPKKAQTSAKKLTVN
ncbi:MAG TPA: Hsp20/alpha crystallin family protein [Methylophilaceae bacterium]|nr:Hsp20/alpha crystallin family protein [Methylophilaceae bacterium]